MFDSRSSLEVLLVPEDQAGDQLADLRKAQMCPAGSLLCCLGGSGQLMLWAPGDRRAPRCSADGHFSDFSWEEVTASSRSVSSFHLLAVGSQGDLKLLEAEAEPSVPVSLLSVQKCSADRLLEAIGEKNHSVCELDSVQVLCFVDGRFRLLVNWSWLLQLQWERESGEAKMISCHYLQPISRTQHAAVQLCGETLFILSSDGLIYVFAVTDGALLASINLPAYLEDDLSSSSSSFCLVQVSADLSTAVVVTQSHAAVAVDLNHYFRLHPDHLLCVGPQSNVPLQHKDHRDQDSLSSSSHCLAALGSALCDDRSWETRLALMCSRAQQVASPSPPSKPAERLWFYSLPHLQASSASASSQSRAPPGGAVVHFSVPETSTPSLLAVSEFSALLTYVTPGNTQTTVALWDMESGSVSYHQSEDVAVPVQHSGERQQRLLLKRSGVFQVMFSMPQQDLLSRLMLFGSAATVDAVCKLNSWGHCSIPFHALQAGLKNRQLDTVDLYLKSKENLLNSSASVCVSEQSADSKQSLKDSVQELFLALDLLCSTVRDLNSEAQSRQFSEQLLNLTLSFINTQIRSVLLLPHCENPDVLNSVKILDTYVTELRNYLKRFPWSSGSSTSNSGAAPPREDEGDEWEQLTTEEVIYQAVLTNQIPRAQAVMWRLNRPEQHLSALRMVGLNHVLSCLQSGNLQTAKTLLTNMGLSVKKELHSICLYTKDRNLRELLVEDMSSHGFLPEDEMQSVSFIRKMEKLGLLPARSCPADPLSQRVPRIAHDELEGRELLEELVEQRSPEEVGELWRNIQLHWVKNWDHDCQTAVLLSRLQHTELSLGDSSVLWRYLTSLHDKHQVAEWIHNQRSSDSLCWPDITPEVISSNTACSIFFKENILDLLARKAVFIPEEMSDLEQLLWRLAQGGGLMAPAPPVPQYCSPVGLDLHSAFVSFCLERNLQYLLYTYLEHYRLTPRNCPLLMDQSLFGSQPWFEMLVKTQEITRNLSDTELVFQASLTSAQVLLPGSQASLSSLLLEGHSLLALASIMFAHGGIDQVMIQGQQAGSVQRTVDPQLLKMALASHSKLRAALFPSGCFGNGTSSDISVYQLLQSIHHLDVSRLFAWQVPNTLNSTETSELPHFSSSQLVGRFALVEKLDYLYYIHHGRPSFAYGNVVIQQLGVCSDVQSMLQKVWLQVYRLALKCFNVPSVTSSAVCFCELLGICSLKLRVDIRAMNTVLQHWNQLEKHTQAKNLLVLKSKAVKLVDAEPGVAEELLGYLEAAVIESLEQRGISRSSYEAAQEWALPVQFSKLHSLELSPVYPRHCAEDRQFIHFLLFVQLYNFPLQQVRSMLRLFGPILQAHLTVAFQDLQVQSRTRSQEPQEQLWVPRSEEAPGSSDLFQVVLRSQQEQIPVRFLLHEAMVQRCPVLAVLAACLKTAELLPCLCVWILTSVDNKTAEEATSHLAEAPQHHEWTLHDLSIIWKTLLWRGQFRILLRGFELFQQDCPLVLVLRMFELCCDYRNFTEAKTKLMDFQRTLIALRNGGPTIIGSLPLQWVESQASVLLLTMLQRSSSQYDLHRLLQLLADVDKLLKSNGPDFRKLSKLSQLLQGSGVTLPQRLLHNTPPSIQEEEFATIVDTLQSRGCYSQARQVAELAGLPVDRLLLSQLLQEANVHKTRWQWRHLETRVAFWRKCHRLLKDDGTDPKLASQFFLSQSEGGTANSGDETQNEVVDVQERCLLLQLAAHWLSLLIPVPVDELERLEKKLWFCQVRKHLLTAIMEKDSMFKLPPAAVHPETNAYEMFMKDFTFSSIADLNMEKYLRLDGFPSPSENLDELDPESDLGSEGRRVLRGLIGQLLDQGGLHEASRVCRHFSIHSPDVWRLLRCHALAGGVLAPEPQDETPEGAETKALTHSPSFSSLSSFVMVPLPEDAVTIQIQRLLDQCRHGSSYCKQILSLYQLSKEMQCPYSQLSREEPQSVLQKLLLLEQPDRFRMAKAFIRAQGLGADAVAELVSDAVLQGLLASAQDLQPGDKQIFRPSEGNESLVQLIKLCDDPNLVGLRLLENLNTVPLRELNSIVELLIVAHSCFSLTCNMEGIVRVLQAARHLSHTYLAPGEHYSLMVRLLTGIGRYNEMTYIFDLLHQSHRFEMLLRKKVETERGQSSSLKTALLDYIKRCLPADSEKHNMVALCFSMRREIGENHEIAARTQLKMIESQDWVVTPELKSSLMKVLGLLKDAAESFSKDSCVRQASRCINQAKLITLQLHLLNRGSNLRIINLKPTELHAAFMALPRCYQVFVISEAYSYNPDWAEILYQKVVLKGDFVYLEELKGLRPLTSAIFEDIFRKLDSTPSGVSSNVKRLLSHCNDVYTRYRLAYQQNLYDVTKTLLQDNKTASYMNDRLNNKAFI